MKLPFRAASSKPPSGGPTLSKRAQQSLAEAASEFAHARDCARTTSGGIDTLRERAEQVVAALDPGGLTRNRAPLPPKSLSPWSKTLLEQTLKPETKFETSVLGRLQTLLAKVPSPDPTLLRDYCEHMDPIRHEHVFRAMERTCSLLGQGLLDVYVSRGDRGIGVRVYAGPPPFLLVGGQHVQEGSPFAMTPREHGFAVGAELAHLHFGHGRATAQEVWAGTAAKATHGIELALTFLPLAKGLAVAAPLREGLGQAARGARRYLDSRTGTQRSAPASTAAPTHQAISSLDEHLIGAHRAQQFTEDRVGLLVADDFVAALLGMLLTRPGATTDLVNLNRLGLEAYLLEDIDGDLTRALLPRILALIGFYLSGDYVRLSQSAR